MTTTDDLQVERLDSINDWRWWEAYIFCRFIFLLSTEVNEI